MKAPVRSAASEFFLALHSMRLLGVLRYAAIIEGVYWGSESKSDTTCANPRYYDTATSHASAAYLTIRTILTVKIYSRAVDRRGSFKERRKFSHMCPTYSVVNCEVISVPVLSPHSPNPQNYQYSGDGVHETNKPLGAVMLMARGLKSGGTFCRKGANRLKIIGSTIYY